MTYREALAKANAAYARIMRLGAPPYRPIDEQVIIQDLRSDLVTGTPDPPPVAPPILPPPLPPCLEVRAA